jgi:hypothetical protein
MFYRCCVVVVLVVVLFHIGRAISLSRIPSNAFYQKPKWFFLWRNSPAGAKASSLSSLHDHTQTHTHSVRILWANYQPNAEASTSQHTHTHINTHTHTRQTSMPPVGFEPAIPGKRGAVDPRLRKRGYWDRLQVIYCSKKIEYRNRQEKIR